MKKPRELVKVGFREQRGTWRVAWWESPQHPGRPVHDRMGARVRKKSFGTEEAAKAYEVELLDKQDAAPEGGDPNMTLGVAFELYFGEKARKRSLGEDRRMAEHLMAAFGKSTRLRDLTAARIATYKARRLAATSVRRKDLDGNPTPLTPASINRPLALLRCLLRLAHEWGVLKTIPSVKLETEPEGRIAWLEPDEEQRLLTACRESEEERLLPIVTIALETGMRSGEIMGMTCERIRGVISLEGRATKSKRRREVPMRQAVYDALAGRPAPRHGRVWPGRSIRTAWETAVAQAKLESALARHDLEAWHFHDLRHHFASWFMMRGGSLLALSKILGHTKISMTEKYAHLAKHHLSGEMARTERPTTVLEPNLEPGAPASDEESTQVVDSTRERRGSSEAEQLIRNQ